MNSFSGIPRKSNSSKRSIFFQKFLYKSKSGKSACSMKDFYEGKSGKKSYFFQDTFFQFVTDLNTLNIEPWDRKAAIGQISVDLYPY